MKKKLLSFVLWIVLVCLFFVLLSLQKERTPVRLEFQDFSQMALAGQFKEIWITGQKLEADTGTQLFESFGSFAAQDLDALAEGDTELNWKARRSGDSGWINVLAGWAPFILVAVFLIFLFRNMSGGGGNSILALRKSTAVILPEERRVTFADVGGCAEAKLLLGDVIAFLKEPRRWKDAGARPPRGILLEGPPGCGKTLLARAVAGETQAAFLSTSGSEFVELFVGVGAARVRDLFERAVKKPPAVVFIDEIDALGRRRGSGMGSSNEEREHTLNQLLVCMDSLEQYDQIVIIAATNRPDVLDSALTRTGRFDWRIKIPPFSRDERLEILRIHGTDKRFADPSALAVLAEQSEGLSGSDLESVLNEAALSALRRPDGGAVITSSDMDTALGSFRKRERKFNKLDLLLVESNSQLMEAGGRAIARLTLLNGLVNEGEVLWADAGFIKVKCEDGTERLLPKSQIASIEALAGTETARPEEFVTAGAKARMPDTA